MPNQKYVDDRFCDVNALYINGKGRDWPNTVWRSLEDLSDENGKPVRGRINFENGYTTTDIA